MSRLLRTAPATLIVLAFLITMMPFSSAEVSYEVTYDDPAGDIQALTRAGAELGDVDITKLTSALEQSILTQEDQIVLRLTVKGKISALDTSGYAVQMESDDEFYVFEYVAGVCTELYSGDAFVATGAGTSTLEIIVPLDKVHEPTEHYDVSSFTAHNSDEGITYMDLCPDDTLILTPRKQTDRPVEILEPTDGAAVYGVAEVRGITHNTQDRPDIKYVEYQIDGKDSDGWVKAPSYDGYMTWSFDWDTTDHTDGPHTVYIRAKNATGHFSTEAEYWVDQGMATSPDSAGMPELRVGDKYWFQGTGDVEVAGIKASLETTHNITVWGAGTIRSSGVDRDVFIYRTETTIVIDAMGIEVTSYAEGFAFQLRSDLSTVMVDQWVNSTIPLQPPSSIHTVAEYDPPLDSMNFPMVVGEKWFSETTTTTTTENEGQTTTDSIYVNAEYECLRPQEVTVPAGTFQTLVKRSENTSGGEEGSGFSGFDTSSLTDGWSLSYYSPELGYPVKEETYDADGKLMNTMDLVDHRRGTGAMIVVLNISTTGDELKVGQKDEIRVQVRNTGIQDASGVTVSVYDSEVLVWEEEKDFPAGETVTLSVPWTPSEEGAHVLMAKTPDDYLKRDVEVMPGEDDELLLPWWAFLLIAVVLFVVLIVIIIIVIRLKKPEEALVVDEVEEEEKAKGKKGAGKRKGAKTGAEEEEERIFVGGKKKGKGKKQG